MYYWCAIPIVIDEETTRRSWCSVSIVSAKASVWYSTTSSLPAHPLHSPSFQVAWISAYSLYIPPSFVSAPTSSVNLRSFCLEITKPSSTITDRFHSKASVQFSSVAQSCPTLCYPMNRSTPGLPVHLSTYHSWTSLVVQWLRLCLPVQGTQVRSLV